MLNILLFKSILRRHEVATATFKHIFKMLNILLFKSIERQHKVETTIFKHIVTMLNILLFRRLTPQSMEGTLFMRRRWKQNSPTNILLFKGTVCQNVVTTVLKTFKFSRSSKGTPNIQQTPKKGLNKANNCNSAHVGGQVSIFTILKKIIRKSVLF